MLAIVLAVLQQGSAVGDGNELEDVGLLAVLPPADEVAAFRLLIPSRCDQVKAVQRDHKGATIGKYRSAHWYAERKSDGLVVSVSVAVTTNSASMDELARRSIETPTGAFPRGNPSGRHIAPQTWHTRKPTTTKVKGAYGLVVRDDRAIVAIRLMRRINHVVDGKAVPTDITEEDLMLAERLAVGCLSRMRARGFAGKR